MRRSSIKDQSGLFLAEKSIADGKLKYIVFQSAIVFDIRSDVGESEHIAHREIESHRQVYSAAKCKAEIEGGKFFFYILFFAVDDAIGSNQQSNLRTCMEIDEVGYLIAGQNGYIDVIEIGIGFKSHNTEFGTLQRVEQFRLYGKMLTQKEMVIQAAMEADSA